MTEHLSMHASICSFLLLFLYGAFFFFCGSVVKNPLAKVGDVGSIPESGRSPGEGNGKPL